MLVDDSLGDGQSQSRAAGLGGKERTKDTIVILRRNPHARVGDCNGRPFALRAAGDSQFAAVGHGLLGVNDDVEQRLAKQFLIRRTVHRSLFGDEAHVNVIGGQQRAAKFDETCDDAVEINLGPLHRARAGKIEELVEQGLQSFGLALQNLDFPEGATTQISWMSIEVLEVLGQQLQVNHHGGEGVAQLMGESARQFRELDHRAARVGRGSAVRTVIR